MLEKIEVALEIIFKIFIIWILLMLGFVLANVVVHIYNVGAEEAFSKRSVVFETKKE